MLFCLLPHKTCAVKLSLGKYHQQSATPRPKSSTINFFAISGRTLYLIERSFHFPAVFRSPKIQAPSGAASSVAAHFQPRTTRTTQKIPFAYFAYFAVRPSTHRRNMPLLTELKYILVFCFYKYGAPTVLHCGALFFCNFIRNKVFN